MENFKKWMPIIIVGVIFGILLGLFLSKSEKINPILRWSIIVLGIFASVLVAGKFSENFNAKK